MREAPHQPPRQREDQAATSRTNKTLIGSDEEDHGIEKLLVFHLAESKQEACADIRESLTSREVPKGLCPGVSLTSCT